MIGDPTGLEWVTTRHRMAVRENVRDMPREGDGVLLYRSRGALRNPTRDKAQIIAVGTVSGPPHHEVVEVGDREYARWFPIRFDALSLPRAGLDFGPFVSKLELTSDKAPTAWGATMRRPLVRLTDRDFRLLDKAYRRHVAGRPASAS